MVEYVEYDEWRVELWRRLVNIKAGALQGLIPLWHIQIENKLNVGDSICVGIPDSLRIEELFLKGSGNLMIESYLSTDVLRAVASVVPEMRDRLSQYDQSQHEQSFLSTKIPVVDAGIGAVASRARRI